MASPAGYDTPVVDSRDRPLQQREYPDEADLSDDDSADLEPCPACGELVYEGAPQCPYCREWMVGGGGRARKTLLTSRLFWLAVAAAAVAVVMLRLLK